MKKYTKKILKNKFKLGSKGFTLVELLAVVAILSIISVIVIYTAVNVIGSANSKSYQFSINNIEKNASVYAIENFGNITWTTVPTDVSGETEYFCLSVQDLINKGYFKSDVLESKISSDTKVSANHLIYLERNAINKSVTKNILLFEERLYNYSGLCSGRAIDEVISFIKVEPRGWGKSKEVTIRYELRDNGNVSDYVYGYRYFDVNGNEVDMNYNDNFNKNVIDIKTDSIKENGTLYAYIKYDGDTISESSLDISKIDLVAPEISVVVDGNGREYTKSKDAVIKLVDLNSGFRVGRYDVYYQWSTNSMTCNQLKNSDSSMKATLLVDYDELKNSSSVSYTVKDKSGAGKLYACADNVSDYVGNELGEVVTSADMYLDNTPPTLPEIDTIYDIWGSNTYTVSGYNSNAGVDGTWITKSDPHISFGNLSRFSGINGAYVELDSAFAEDIVVQIYYATSTGVYSEANSNIATLKAGNNKIYIPFTKSGEWTKVRFDIGTSQGLEYKINALGVSANKAQWNNNDIYLNLTTIEEHSGVDHWRYTYLENATTIGGNSSSTWVKHGNSDNAKFIPNAYSASRNRYTYLMVCDKVGNCSGISKDMIMIDKIVPSTPTYVASFNDGSGNYTSGEYSNKQVNTTISTIDSGPSDVYIQYKDINTDTWSTFNFRLSDGIKKNGTTWSGVEPWTYKFRNDTYNFRACDLAGNCSSSSEIFNINYADLYTISYDACGGTGAPGAQTKRQGTALTLSTVKPKKSGYLFKGWSTAASCTAATTVNYAAGASYVTDANDTLYAVWDKDPPPEKPILVPIYDLWGSRSYTATNYEKDAGVSGTWTTKGDPYISFGNIGNIRGVTGAYVQLDSSLSKDIVVQVFYATSTGGFDETNSDRATLKAGDRKIYIPFTKSGEWKKVRFDIGSDEGIQYKINALGVSINEAQWNKDDIYLKADSTDVDTGIKYWQYSYDINGGWVTYSDSAMDTFFTTPYSQSRNQLTYIRACDYADNCSEASSTKIMIDKIVPSTPTYVASFNDGSGNYTPGTYSNKQVNTTISTIDSGPSDVYIQYKDINTDTWSTFNFSLSGGIKKNGTTWSGIEPWTYKYRNDTYNFRACDLAENCSSLSESFNIRYASLYTISYDACGGTDAPGAQTKQQGTALILSSNKPKKKGYLFKGWSTAASCTAATTVNYAAGASYVTDASDVLYAVWEKDSTPPMKPTLIPIYDLWGSRSYTVTHYEKDVGVSGTWTTKGDPYISFGNIGNIKGVTGAYVELASELDNDIDVQVFYETNGNGFGQTNSDRATLKAGDRKIYIPFTKSGEWTKVRFDIGATAGLQYKINALGVSANEAQWNNDEIYLKVNSTDENAGIKYWQYSYKNSASSTTGNANTGWVTYSDSEMDTFFTTPYSAERNQLTYIRVCDHMDNCSSVSSTMIMIDKSAPTELNIVTFYNLWGTWFDGEAFKEYTVNNYKKDVGPSGVWETKFDPHISFSGIDHLTGINGAHVQLKKALDKDIDVQVYYATSEGGFNENNSDIKKLNAGEKDIYIPFTKSGEWKKVRFDIGTEAGLTYEIKILSVAATAGQWHNHFIPFRVEAKENGSGIKNWQETYSATAVKEGTVPGVDTDTLWAPYESSDKTPFFPPIHGITKEVEHYIRACDWSGSGNCSARVSNSIKIERTRPEFGLSASISGRTITATIEDVIDPPGLDGLISGLTEDYYYALISNTTDCTNNVSFTKTKSKSYSLTAGAAGEWRVCIKVTDKAGNYGLESKRYTVS